MSDSATCPSATDSLGFKRDQCNCKPVPGLLRKKVEMTGIFHQFCPMHTVNTAWPTHTSYVDGRRSHRESCTVPADMERLRRASDGIIKETSVIAMLPKSIAFFAFFVLGAVNAKPCKPGASVTSSDLSPSKTTTPASETTSTSYDATPSLGYSGDICNAKNPAPINRVCGAHGYITNHDGAWEFSLSAADLDSCADLCFRRTGCVTFSYMDSWCQLFSTQISNMGFSQDRKGPPFHELGCFNCVPNGQLSCTLF
ncbi:hypothetical protein AUP68_11889 [Ilyonectria robusta]